MVYIVIVNDKVVGAFKYRDVAEDCARSYKEKWNVVKVEPVVFHDARAFVIALWYT